MRRGRGRRLRTILVLLYHFIQFAASLVGTIILRLLSGVITRSAGGPAGRGEHALGVPASGMETTEGSGELIDDTENIRTGNGEHWRPWSPDAGSC